MTDRRDSTDSAYRNWRTRVFKPAAKKAGLEGIRPYDLRGSFCSLLLAAGVNLAEIADEAGNSVEVLSSNYLGVIKELRGKPPVEPEHAIRDARSVIGGSSSKASPTRTCGASVLPVRETLPEAAVLV